MTIIDDTRRGFIKSAGAAGAAMAVSPLSRIFGAQIETDYNVLLVVCDALRADRLGCYGYERALPGGARGSTTPFIDQLATDGIVYENCIAQSSWTQTSMCSMLYSAWPVIKGSEHCFAYVPEGSKTPKQATPNLTRAAIQANPWLRHEIFSRFWDIHKYLAGAEYARADKMNDEFDWEIAPLVREDKPFFAYIHYMEPHEPYTHKHPFRGTLAPKDWTYFHPLALCGRASRYHDDTGKIVTEIPPAVMAPIYGMGEAYDEDVLYLDLQIGRLFEMLRGYGVLDKTFVIFTSDHGQSFGEHGWAGHKQSLYQEEIHIPLIVKGPGLPAAERLKTQVRGVDILPTIAAICGVSVEGLVGAPLLPVHRVAAGGDRLAYSCCDYAKFGEVLRLLTCLVTPKRQKYIRILTQGHILLREELFDLEADPGEKRDLVAENPETVKALSALMDEFEGKAFWKWPTRQQEKMDEATRKQLEALGYLNQ